MTPDYTAAILIAAILIAFGLRDMGRRGGRRGRRR